MERRHFEWEGCLNARDLGGLPTADGRLTRERILLRGDTTCALSERGRQQVLADGVRTILDLRGDTELEKEPNPFAATYGITYLHRPFNDTAVEERIRSIESPPERYVTMIDADGERVAAIFDVLATAPRAVLFHCLGGRDRTGMVAALALGLVGVPAERIEDDFVLSDERMAPRYDRWRTGFDAAQAERFDLSLREARASIRAALARVRERWGGVAGYLLAHGLPRDRIDALRTELVRPPKP